jgi:hypothetical protein
MNRGPLAQDQNDSSASSTRTPAGAADGDALELDIGRLGFGRGHARKTQWSAFGRGGLASDGDPPDPFLGRLP